MTSENGGDGVVVTLPASRKPPVLGAARPDPEGGKRIPEMATIEMASALPKLADDALVGVEMDHVVTQDDQPDLKFRGTLLASVGPDSAPRGRWRELRVYRTVGGNMVFSIIGRSVLDGERDKFAAATHSYYPGVSTYKNGSKISTPSTDADQQARALTRFFEFSDLAKKLYAKLGVSTEEVIE